MAALHAPQLTIPPSASGPLEAIIPVLIVPRVPRPSAAPGTRPAEIRLHRRPQRFGPIPADVTPMIVTRPAVARPVETERPRTGLSPSLPDPLAATARRALRGKVGCANAGAVGLTRAEREAYEDQFAAGAKESPFIGLGLERGKAAGLAAAAARREADLRYKRSEKVPAPATGGLQWDTARSAPGSGQAEELDVSLGNDRAVAKVPF